MKKPRFSEISPPLSEYAQRGIPFVHDERQVECQATFKEHCTFPKCDCDRRKE